jgi:hypothetical protein
MKDEQFYILAGERFAQKRDKNLKIIQSNNRKIDSGKLSYYDRENLYADNKSRRKAINLIEDTYKKRIKDLEFFNPQMVRALRAGYES